jgi:hypothetical protein
MIEPPQRQNTDQKPVPGEHDDPTTRQPARPVERQRFDRSHRQCVSRAPSPASRRLNETIEAVRR